MHVTIAISDNFVYLANTRRYECYPEADKIYISPFFLIA